MTFLEKFKEDNPNMHIDEYCRGIGCPSDRKYEEKRPDNCGGIYCKECWNREMPNTNKSILLTMNKETELNIDKKIKEQEEKSYNQGLNDAWELAKKCVLLDGRGEDNELMMEIFGTVFLDKLFNNNTYQEALAKLKAYEEAQSKIDIGDVVVDLHEQKGLVIGILHDEDKVDVWYEDNSRPQIVSTRFLTKTGEHVNLGKILKQIGE